MICRWWLHRWGPWRYEGTERGVWRVWNCARCPTQLRWLQWPEEEVVTW